MGTSEIFIRFPPNGSRICVTLSPASTAAIVRTRNNRLRDPAHSEKSASRCKIVSYGSHAFRLCACEHEAAKVRPIRQLRPVPELSTRNPFLDSYAWVVFRGQNLFLRLPGDEYPT